MVNHLAKFMNLVSGPKKKVSAQVANRVGQFIVKNSYFESLLSAIVYMLLGVNHRQGRVAVRDPRVADQFAMIVTLCKFTKVIPPNDLAATKKLAVDIEEFRNLIAHGVWHRHPEKPYLAIRQVSGNWSPNGKDSISRRVMPEHVPMSPQILDDWLKDISRLIREVEALERTVRKQLSALQKKQIRKSA